MLVITSMALEEVRVLQLRKPTVSDVEQVSG
jgi:hypothetical protein